MQRHLRVLLMVVASALVCSDSAEAAAARQQADADRIRAEQEHRCRKVAEERTASVPAKRYVVHREPGGPEYLIDRDELREREYQACLADPPDPSSDLPPTPA